jgi:hypothetical protein
VTARREPATMSNMIAASSSTPIGTGESAGGMVPDSIRIVRASGLPSETDATFTHIVGECDEVMAVITACWTTAQANPAVGGRTNPIRRAQTPEFGSVPIGICIMQ